MRTGLLVVSFSMLVAGCALGPDYQRPEQELPQEFQTADAGDWQRAQPAELADKGQWWQLYQDKQLNELLELLDNNNQNLTAAEAAWRMAEAALGGTSSGLYPQVSASGSSTRSKEVDSPSRKNKDVKLGMNWQLDLWGQVRREIEAGRAQLEASAADWANLRLSQQAMLVQNYMQLRVMDEQIRILDRNIAAYERVLNISQRRYEAGMVTKADVSQSLSQLKSAQAQQLDVHSQRRRLEHSLAVLIGQPAGHYQLTASLELPQLPALPMDVPSSLLERRPDIAAAERRVMAANAEIGVAQTAYFPSFSFGANAGYRSNQWSGLLDSPNKYWSFGPQFDMRLFDAGARKSRKAQAMANHDQQVARYRQATLEAIAEVEDALVQLASLELEYQVQAEAEVAAKEAWQLVENQYRAGIVDFVALSNAQTTALNAERTLLNLRSTQLLASVQLISALGGGWDAQQLEQ